MSKRYLTLGTDVLDTQSYDVIATAKSDALAQHIADEMNNALQLATVTAERGELFNVAVKAFQAVEQMDLKGELSKYSAMQNLDYVCARISKKLWERVDAAALKGGKG